MSKNISWLISYRTELFWRTLVLYISDIDSKLPKDITIDGVRLYSWEFPCSWMTNWDTILIAIGTDRGRAIIMDYLDERSADDAMTKIEDAFERINRWDLLK